MPIVLSMLFLAGKGLGLRSIVLSPAEWSRMAGFRAERWLVASGDRRLRRLLYLARPGVCAAAAMTASIAAAFWIFAAPLVARGEAGRRLGVAVAGWIVAWPLWFALVVCAMRPWLLLAAAAGVDRRHRAYFAASGSATQLAPR